MNRYEFTFVVDHEFADEELDALVEAGCDDATPEVGLGRSLLHFHREAGSLPEALVSALHDVSRAVAGVVAVQSDDLVTVRDIAERAGRSYESVRLLAAGKRGPGGFPTPMSSSGWQFYSWAQVGAWLTRHYPDDVVNDLPTEYDRLIAAADHLVRARVIAGDAGLRALVPLVA